MDQHNQQHETQASLSGVCPVESALDELRSAGVEQRGAIFTRTEVVEFILDLAGYTADKPLYRRSLLEPSFGEGDFLMVAIERLLVSWKKHAGQDASPDVLRSAVTAVELHDDTYTATRAQVIELLKKAAIDQEMAEELADNWLIKGDFLLTPMAGTFDLVVGNPPYVRQELIPDALIAEYRCRYKTVFDRADIYIPFIERSLDLLDNGGVLAFICADRWMKNRYGGPLREMIANDYHLRVYIDMVDTPAFHSEVIAYPAITVIAKEKGTRTRIVRRPAIERDELRMLSHSLVAKNMPAAGSPIKELAGVAAGREPWILESFDQLAVVRRLEQDFPAIEDAGCKVGIGVATGADKAFIGPFHELAVEADRKLPLVMTRDIKSGHVQWHGFGIVNPFADEGGLVPLDRYPKLKAYLEERKDQIDKRHVAQKAPANWYRTIDRIYPALAKRPKLLIPDIKGEAQIVFEGGKLYPHHNLYYIISDTWDLQALQAVLLSGIARLFVSTYSTRMRGGYFRFQAQYLRRIRLPRWDDVDKSLRKSLIDAARTGDAECCNEAAFLLYGLDKEERAALGGNGEG